VGNILLRAISKPLWQLETAVIILVHGVYAFLFSPIHATCPEHLILFYLIILILFDEEYKL
jgi:hypothetical protein